MADDEELDADTLRESLAEVEALIRQSPGDPPSEALQVLSRRSAACWGYLLGLRADLGSVQLQEELKLALGLARGAEASEGAAGEQLVSQLCPCGLSAWLVVQ